MSRTCGSAILCGTLLILATFSAGCGSGSPVQPQAAAPACDQTLWNHVYDPTRLHVVDSCRTVTGIVVAQHTSGDGDVNSELALDPGFADLLNDGNMTKLNGHLQVEEICQGKITRDAFDSCKGYTGTALVPPVGSHISVTGSHVRDGNHGWMEIHPVSQITLLP